MTHARKIVIVLVIAVIGAVGWFAYGVIHTVRHIPEAYAAWDTGTLLVEYMKENDERWPKSWEDLISIVRSDSDRRVLLYGARAGDVEYARSLKDKVSIDWAFDPARPDAESPVTRPDGKKFSVVWSGAEPNEMVRSYLAERPSTRPTAGR